MSDYFLGVMGVPLLQPVSPAGRGAAVRLSRADRALLSLMAMHPVRVGLSRERLADLLWPDCPFDQACSRLSSALWRLRKSIGAPRSAPVIEEHNGRIGLARDGSVTVDVWELKRLGDSLRGRPVGEWQTEEATALESAMQDRRGEFLAGVDGEWTLAARQICAEAYEFALECLMRFHRSRGHADRSIAAARHLVRQDPYREDIHAVLVQLYTEKGQRRRAIAQYSECRDLLKAELGVDPGPDLRDSLDVALGRRQATTGPTDVGQVIRRLDQSVADLARQLTELRRLV